MAGRGEENHPKVQKSHAQEPTASSSSDPQAPEVESSRITCAETLCFFSTSCFSFVEVVQHSTSFTKHCVVILITNDVEEMKHSMQNALITTTIYVHFVKNILMYF